ncbi:unnamed protein product [Polarella glacialis]|uniref:RBR-type E3 ubiquitin transferase n=1 Tax=Polarella glacialis TaxID=89957 RepID=A0A813J1J1_POLGL|nr:unnamed protein product [Polarella glacialis]
MSRWMRAARANNNNDSNNDSNNTDHHNDGCAQPVPLLEEVPPSCELENCTGGGSSSSRSPAPLRKEASRCPICLEDVTVDADLPCGHSACAACIVQYVESLVNCGKVSDDDMACPLPSCRVPLGQATAERLLRNSAEPGGGQLLERLLDFQARRFVPEPGDGERLVTCPTAGCMKVLVPTTLVEERSEVLCPGCSRHFCAGCETPTHPGTSCEAAELERMDPLLRQLISQQNWKRCPVCRNLCERGSGCNFMTCPSEQCKSQTFFCYLCGELLAAADHASHYEGFEGAVGLRGPFGSVCANKREQDLSWPTKPAPPRLSVVLGDEEGTIALRLTWGEHRSEPPTIYYKVRLLSPPPGGSDEVKYLEIQAGEPHHDVQRRRIQYRRYQAVVVPVNVNGAGPASEPSEVVHFHPRELETLKERERTLDKAAAQRSEKGKRWATK